MQINSITGYLTKSNFSPLKNLQKISKNFNSNPINNSINFKGILQEDTFTPSIGKKPTEAEREEYAKKVIAQIEERIKEYENIPHRNHPLINKESLNLADIIIYEILDDSKEKALISELDKVIDSYYESLQKTTTKRKKEENRKNHEAQALEIVNKHLSNLEIQSDVT